MFDQPTRTEHADGSVSWELGFGITHTASARTMAALDRGYALARKTEPALRAQLDALSVPQLKALALKAIPGRVRGYGLTTRRDFVDVLLTWHTNECLKAAGYVDSRR